MIINAYTYDNYGQIIALGESYYWERSGIAIKTSLGNKTSGPKMSKSELLVC